MQKEQLHLYMLQPGKTGYHKFTDNDAEHARNAKRTKTGWTADK
jgi:cell division protein YceG involved in septum cleavage